MAVRPRSPRNDLQGRLAPIFKATLHRFLCGLRRLAHLMAVVQDQLRNFLVRSAKVFSHGSSFQDQGRREDKRHWIARRGLQGIR